MLAFHGNKAIKAQYLQRVKLHEKADEIIHGKYWENGKGCAVGCTIHSSNHLAYESELGIPLILARLEDRIFEGMKNGDAKKFPARFLSAIRPGADLSMVWPRFAVWLLVDKQHGVIRFAKKDSPQWVVIHRVATLYRELKDWDKRDRQAFKDAAAAAYAAAAYAAAYPAAAYAAAAYAAAYPDAAYAADADAADAAAAAYAAAAYAAAYPDAAYADAADADADAADAAAYPDAAAAYAAYAYADAAYADAAYADAAYADAAYADAADAAAAAYAAAAAADADAVRSKAYKAQADKLIELLKAA